jgi:hypothetical protein
MEESRGIILFNRGEKCILRAIVCLYSLRKHYDGKVTFFLEQPYPREFDEVCKYFNCDIVHNEENHNLSVLVRKTDMFGNPPYDRTLWIDSDTVIVGKLDEMFDYLDDYDVCIPNFCNWISSGHHISKRIKRFKDIIEDKYIEEALKSHPAINTGVLSFKKSDKWKKFVNDWVNVADAGSKKHVFISDEVSFQVLYPSIKDWGLSCFIAPSKFNVSVMYGEQIEDKRCIHAHGQKHCIDVPLAQVWKDTFKEMCDNNIANINYFLKYADKRLTRYLKGEVVWGGKKKKIKSKECSECPEGSQEDVTIVTACDTKYVEILRETYPNWVKYKKVDKHPVIVFFNGMDEQDSRLDFLRQPNITLIPWNEDSMDKVDSHRELMLSCFVLGTAQHVKTDYWIKLDADTYATDNRPLYDEDFKNYAFVSHKWGYSRPEFIVKLDEWAKGHWKNKLKNATPMMSDGRVDGNRFYHNGKRNISFVQFHKTKFIKFCVKLLKENRLPVPSHDTYTYFVCKKFDPQLMMLKNFKKNYGYTQGNGKTSIEDFRKKLQEVDLANEGKINVDTEVLNEDECMESDYFNEDVKNVISDLSVTFVQKEIDVKPIDIFPPICRCPEGNGNIVEIRIKQ